MRALTVGAFGIGALALATADPVRAQVAVRGAVVHTMAPDENGETEPLRDAVVLCEGGKVVAVGPAAETPIPEGWTVLEAAVVTPGLIDAHTVVGLAGYLNQEHDQDQLEGSAPIQPELRAIDAYNPRERLIEWLREFGVTTIHTGHGPGAVISGQTMIAKTVGDTVDEATFVPTAMIAATLGEGATGNGSGAPGTRSKAVALLRAELIKARGYLDRLEKAEEGEEPARDLRLEALGQLLTRELPLLVTAHKANDILSALRLAEEFDLRLVLDGASEAPLVVDRILEAGVPVILHPTMMRAHEETESLSMESATVLHAAGVQLALQSGYESYVPKTRVVMFEAAIAAAYGLGFQDALALITIDAARILGVDDRVGSLEVGKDADLALYDGDPFEYASHCVGVVIEGEVVSTTVR